MLLPSAFRYDAKPRHGRATEESAVSAPRSGRAVAPGDAPGVNAAIPACGASEFRPTVDAVSNTRMNWRIPRGQQAGLGFGSRNVDLSGAAGGRGGGPGRLRPGNAGPRMPPPARRERHFDCQRRLDRSCRHTLGRIALAHGTPPRRERLAIPNCVAAGCPAPMMCGPSFGRVR
jgi:hypothetical protein